MTETTSTPRRKPGRPRRADRSHQVTFRMPESLYQKLLAIADSIYQPAPVVFRMALIDYAKTHRPVRHTNHGIALSWPTKVIPPPESDPVTTDDTALSPSPETT